MPMLADNDHFKDKCHFDEDNLLQEYQVACNF